MGAGTFNQFKELGGQVAGAGTRPTDEDDLFLLACWPVCPTYNAEKREGLPEKYAAPELGEAVHTSRTPKSPGGSTVSELL